MILHNLTDKEIKIGNSVLPPLNIKLEEGPGYKKTHRKFKFYDEEVVVYQKMHYYSYLPPEVEGVMYVLPEKVAEHMSSQRQDLCYYNGKDLMRP